MAILNAPTHPQVLFAGFEADDPRLLAMQQLVGAHHLLDGFVSDEPRIRPKDWDALVIEGDLEAIDLAGHWQVLAFAPPPDEFESWGATGRNGANIYRDIQQHSPTLHTVDKNLPGGAASILFKNETLQFLNSVTPPMPRLFGLNPLTEDPDHQLRAGGPFPQNQRMRAMPGCRPVLLDADGFFVAGEFPLRSVTYASGVKSDPNCWYVPHPSAHPEVWLAQMLSIWHKRDPERFPIAHPWRARREWMSASERSADSERERLVLERAQTLKAIDSKIIEADNALVAASAATEIGARRLLTKQGEPLVSAVIAALTLLGFDVIDVDADRPDGQAKAEDLDLKDPSRPDVEIIAEVKGYASGAKSRDLQQIGQHAKRHQLRTGSFPDRSWYIVNQFKDEDPATRPGLLPGSEENVSVFSEDGGLVIDTRDLWRLVREIEDGALEAEAVRAYLIGATGLLDLSFILSDETEARETFS